MNEFGISENSYHLILKSFEKFPAIEKVLIFGSRAKGNYKNGSDIDLAIFGNHCSQQVANDLNVMLNEHLPIPYKVDVIDYASLNHAELRGHINRVGKIFYKKI